MLRSTTLLGSSSGRNTGDAALIAAIIDSVDSACGTTLTHEIPTIRPHYIRDHYPVNARPVGMLPWNLSVKMLGLPTYRSIMRTDLSLIFDAILFDRALYNPLFNFLSTLHLFLPRARKQGKRMACYDVGTGPVSTPAGKRMLREIAELMEFIAVRDQDSFDILKDIGVQNPRLFIAADAALNAPAAPEARVRPILEQRGIRAGRPTLAVNINLYLDTWAQTGRPSIGRERFLEVYAGALKRAMREIDAQWLFVTTQHADVTITRELMARLPPDPPAALITNVEFNHVDMKGILRSVDLLFGMRLHAMILASSEKTPIVGLAYQPKIHHYYSTLGLRERSLGFEAFDEDAVYRHIVEGWRDRAALRAHLQAAVPPLQKRARRPAELIAALHRGEDMDAAYRRISQG